MYLAQFLRTPRNATGHTDGNQSFSFLDMPLWTALMSLVVTSLTSADLLVSLCGWPAYSGSEKFCPGRKPILGGNKFGGGGGKFNKRDRESTPDFRYSGGPIIHVVNSAKCVVNGLRDEVLVSEKDNSLNSKFPSQFN